MARALCVAHARVRRYYGGGAYTVRYYDGSGGRTPIDEGSNIADWWHPRDLEKDEWAWRDIHLVRGGRVGVRMMKRPNPDPDKKVASIDVNGGVAGEVIPVLLAITVEKR